MGELIHGRIPHRHTLDGGPLVALALGIIRVAAHDVSKANNRRFQRQISGELHDGNSPTDANARDAIDFLRSNDRLPMVLRLAGLDDKRFVDYVRSKALSHP